MYRQNVRPAIDVSRARHPARKPRRPSSRRHVLPNRSSGGRLHFVDGVKLCGNYAHRCVQVGLIGLNGRGILTQCGEARRGTQEHEHGCQQDDPFPKLANCRHRAGRSCANSSWIYVSIRGVAFRAELSTILYFCGRQMSEAE
jgi:hypothetical protein